MTEYQSSRTKFGIYLHTGKKKVGIVHVLTKRIKKFNHL